MKQFVFIVLAIVLCAATQILAQNNEIEKANAERRESTNAIENISLETAKIAKSVEALNKLLKNFSETFSSNQGNRLTERQQKLLLAFEFLNRAEQRLATLQKLNIELSEKQSAIKTRLAKLEEDSRPESIDRAVGSLGTLNAEEMRGMRRQFFNKERNELTALAIEIQKTISETVAEIRQTESFLKNIRHRIFPEIEKELSDL